MCGGVDFVLEGTATAETEVAACQRHVYSRDRREAGVGGGGEETRRRGVRK